VKTRTKEEGKAYPRRRLERGINGDQEGKDDYFHHGEKFDDGIREEGESRDESRWLRNRRTTKIEGVRL